MRKTKKTAVVAGSTVALLGAGIAFAAWTSTGTGTGTVTADSQKDLTVAKVADVAGLYPTGSQDIDFRVTNNNPYAVKIRSVVPSVDAVAGNDGCTLASSAVTTALKGAVGQVVAAGGSQVYTATVSMGESSADACQGAAFTIKAIASGDSAASN